MKTTWKRGLSFVVSASMVLGLVPAPALAQMTNASGDDEAIVELAPLQEDDVNAKGVSFDAQQEGSAQDGVSLDDPAAPTDDPAAPTSVEEPNLEVQSDNSITQMQLDTVYEAKVTEEGGYWVGSFTASEDGIYIFYSRTADGSYVDTYGHLYSDAGLTNEIAYDDDSNENGQFKITQSLSANQTVYLKAREYSNDTMTCNVTVARFNEKDLANGTLKLNAYYYALSNGKLVLDATVCDYLGNELVAGTDFDFVYVSNDGAESTTAPTQAGSYSVYVKGKNGYTGRTNADGFEIVSSRTLKYGTIMLVKSSYVATGNPAPIHATVRDVAGNELVENRDYTLVFIDDDYNESAVVPSELGHYGVFARGRDNYEGDTSAYYFSIIESYDLTGGYINLDPNRFEATGSPVVLNAVVYDNDYNNPLPGTDCELVYLAWDNDECDWNELDSAPSEPGDYGVCARGIAGVSTGQTDITGFSIVNRSDLSQGEIALGKREYSITDGTIVLDATVRDAMGTKLVAGTDYNLVYVDSEGAESTTAPTEEGSYYVYARALGDFYTGQTDSSWFSVYDPYNLAGDYFSASFDDSGVFEYTGEAVSLPTVRIWRYDIATYNDVYLKEGTDFKFSHIEDSDGHKLSSMPSQIGSYYAVYEGVLPYKGVRRVWFAIRGNGYDLTLATLRLDEDSVDYSGSAIQLYPYVRDVNGSDLWEGEDYELVYYDETGTKLSGAPSATGTYYIAACAKEGTSYTGETPRVRFRICDTNDIGHSNYWAYYRRSVVAHSGQPVAPPAVTICYEDTETYDNVYLKSGIDFDLDHIEDEKGNDLGKTVTSVGRYYAVYVGQDPYTGFRSVSFRVVDSHDLTYASISLADDDVPLVNGVATPKVTVTDAAGNVLALGTDYTLVYMKDGEEVDAATSEGHYEVYAKPGSNAVYQNTTDTISMWTYDPNDISRWTWSSSFMPNNRVALGSSTLPTVEIYRYEGNHAITLREGTDFELDHIESVVDYDDEAPAPTNYGKTVPSTVGTYCAVYKGKNPYSGTRSVQFYVYDPYDLGAKDDYGDSFWQSHFSPNGMVSLGSTELPKPVIYRTDDEDSMASIRLTLGTHFELARIENTNEDNLGTTVPTQVGDYYAVYRGKAPYHGEIRIRFSVYRQNSIDSSYWNSHFVGGSTFYTDGGAITLPRLLIYRYDEQLALTEGKDYKFVRFENRDGQTLSTAPSEQGSYYAVYEGMGNYEGTRREWFAINTSYNLSNATIKLAQRKFDVGNKPVVLEVKVRDSSGIKLDPAKDYELVYYDEKGEVLAEAPSQKGTYFVAAKAKSGSRYLGETPWVSFTIGDSGSTVQPGPNPDAKPMVLDVFQDVSLEHGQYWLGSFTAPQYGVYAFSSTGDQDSYGVLYADAGMTEQLAYDDDNGEGSNFRIKKVLKANQTVFLLARGYGNAAIQCAVGVTAIDMYDLANATVSTEGGDAVLQGSVYVPQVTVTDAAGNELAEGTHYTLAYYQYVNGDYEAIDQITEAGDYYVVATAKENSGYKNKTPFIGLWVYSANDLSSARLVRTDGPGYEVGTDVSAQFSVVDRAGKTLKRGTDYELAFYKNEDDVTVRLSSAPTEVGSYYVIARAKGTTYTGRTGTQNFSIYNPNDISANGYMYLEGYDYNKDMGYGNIPVYLWSGSPVEPSVSVYCNGTLANNEYTVTYANNSGPTADGEFATVTVTGKSPFMGSITKPFVIVSDLNLSNFVESAGVRVTAAGETNYWSGSSDLDASMNFLVADWPTDPEVRFTTYRNVTPIQGTDFTVSYADENGTALAETPSKEGKYQLVLTSKAGGMCTGEARLRFALVSTRDLDEGSYPSLHQSGYLLASTDTDVDGTYTIDFYDVLDSVGSFFVDLYVGGKALIENLDYTVSAAADGIYMLKGIGSYEESLRVRVTGSKDMQAAFEVRSASTGDSVYVDGRYANAVYCTSDGTLLAPTVRISGLTYGADFTFDGFENKAGVTITSANEGDTVFARAKGLGDYNGCSRKIEAVVVEGSGLADISSSSAYMQIDNGWRVYEGGKAQWYMLKTAVPSVSVVVYKRMRLVLSQDQGLFVTSTVSADQKTRTITATVAAGLPATGSCTMTANLVDSYDLNKFCKTVYVNDVYGQQIPYPTNSPVRLAYSGVNFMPTVTIPTSGNIGSEPQVTITLKNSSGKEVSAITGTGNYTLVVAGTGNWSGRYDIPLVVEPSNEIIRLENCYLEVGENTQLVNGKAQPTVTLTYGNCIIDPANYNVEYGNNTKDGERGWIRVTAKSGGIYAGTRKANFVVGVSTNLRSADFALCLANPKGGGFVEVTSGGTYTYAVIGNVGPAVKVYRRGSSNTLTELDASKYSVTYGDLTKTGLTYVKVTGKNGFTGSMSANFYVVPSKPTSIAKATVTLGATSYTYNGKAKSPGVKSVVLNGVTLVEGKDYKVTAPSGRTNVGTYTYTVTGIGAYEGTATASFKINQAASSIKLAAQSKTYNGKAQAYSGKVTKTGSTGKVTYAYYSDAKGTKSVKASAVKNAAVYYVRATLAADTNYKSAKSSLVKFTIAKAANPMQVTASNPSISYGTLKKNAVTVAPFTVTKNQGKVTYAKTSGNAAFTVNKTTGKITVKKGTKKNKYTIKVTVTAAGDANYKALNKAMTITVTVK